MDSFPLTGLFCFCLTPIHRLAKVWAELNSAKSACKPKPLFCGKIKTTHNIQGFGPLISGSHTKTLKRVTFYLHYYVQNNRILLLS